MAVNSARGEGSFRVNASDKHLQHLKQWVQKPGGGASRSNWDAFLLQKTISTSIFILYLPAEITKIDIFSKNRVRDNLKWRQEEKINEEPYYSNTTVYFVNRKMWNYQWAIRFCRRDKRTGYIVLYRHKTGRKSRSVYKSSL